MNNSTFISYVKKLMEKTCVSLKHAPDGTLNIKHCRDNLQYFHNLKDTSEKRTYIQKSNYSLIVALAQKDYNQKVLKALTSSLNAAERFYSKSITEVYTECDNAMFAGLYRTLDSVYYSLTPERRNLITPIVPVTEQYIKNWNEQPYDPRKFSDMDQTAYFTKLNVRVRSKSELYIGNCLTDVGIPYKYECPLYLGSIKLHPDFTVLDPYIRHTKYLEHCGMMDNPEYADAFIKKINLYISNGILPGRNLILTYESSKHPLGTRTINQLLKYHFPFNFMEVFHKSMQI